MIEVCMMMMMMMMMMTGDGATQWRAVTALRLKWLA